MTTGPRIYKSGDFIWLVFDPLPGNTTPHSVSIPISDKGIEALLHILTEIEVSPFKGRDHIATKPVPVQSMVDDWLRNGGVIKRKKQEAKDDLSIEDLDL